MSNNTGKIGLSATGLAVGLSGLLTGCDSRINSQIDAYPNNHAPTMQTLSNIIINEGDTLDISGAAAAAASDEDGDLLDFQYGAPLNANGQWTPDYDDAGFYPGISVTARDGKGGEVTGQFDLTVDDVNRDPVINPITPTPVYNEGDVVRISELLTAIDPDGDLVAVTAPQFTAGEWQTDYDDANTYNITFTADDGRGGTDTENIAVIVNNTDGPPVIDRPVTPVVVDENVMGQASATATDPDPGDIVTLTYTSGTLTVNPITGEFTPGYDDAGAHTIIVEAESNGLTDTENIPITVNNVNRSPVIDRPVTPVIVDENVMGQASATATDPDLDTVTMTYTSGTLTVNPTTGEFTPDYDDAGAHIINVLADDGNGGTDTENIPITVNNVNRPPILDTLTAIVANELDLIQATATATDPDGDTVTITYGPPLDASGQWQTDYNSAGTYQVTVTANDGNGGIDTDFLDVTVNNVNRSPVIDRPVTPVIVDENVTGQASATATDPDLDTVTMTYTSGTLTVNPTTGEFTPDYDDAGAHIINVLADDGNGGTDTENIPITVNDVNRPPVIDRPVTPVVVDENVQGQASATATDLDPGDIVTLTYTSGTLTVNPATGEFTPDYDDAGAHIINVLADDGNGGTDTENIPITVNNINQPPVIDRPVTPVIVDENVTGQASATATDPDLDTVTMTYTSGTLTVNPTTGEFTPDYDDAGAHIINVLADDGNGGTDTENIPITVNDINRPPVMDPLVNIIVDEGYLVVVTPTATDPDGDPVNFTYDLPLDANGQWMTVPGDRGTYQNILVTAHDGKGGTDVQALDITVRELYQILFTSYRSPHTGNAELYSIWSDGTGVTRITNHPDDDVYASWNHDKSRVAWMRKVTPSTYDIVVADADGSNEVNLTNDPGTWQGMPSFNEDGTEIIFIEGGNIWTMDSTTGGNRIRRTNTPEQEMWPRCNESGTHIIYSRFYSGDEEIFEMNYDGTGQTRITNSWGTDSHPHYNGTEIFFTSERIGFVNRIFKMDLSGANVTQLTTGSWDECPSPSPYGMRIVYASDSPGNMNIWDMNPDGTDQRQITIDPGTDDAPEGS